MQRVTLVRYTTKPDRAEENESLARAMFQSLRAAAPPGVAYVLLRDDADFVHVFINTRADDAVALTELPVFKAYTKDILDRRLAPPEQIRLGAHLLEAYGLSDETLGSR